MSHKIRKLTFPVLLTGLAAVLMAPPAEANRGNTTTTTTTTRPGYVPPPQYGQTQPNIPDEPNPYANPLAPTVLSVELPAVTDPGAGDAGDGNPLGPAPNNGVQDRSETRPDDEGFMGGILSRTGAESLPLARAGLAALALGIGLVVMARRRRVDAASA